MQLFYTLTFDGTGVFVKRFLNTVLIIVAYVKNNWQCVRMHEILCTDNM